MALPRINDTPQYEVTIPSLNKKVRFRPYLVKEEKVLMLAQETGDMGEILNAICETLKACLPDDVNVDDLATFDIDYLFMQIRGKSVGETADILYDCSSCQEKVAHSVPISQVKPTKVSKKTKRVKLNNEVELELRYPSYSRITLIGEPERQNDIAMEIVQSAVKSVCTQEEIFDCDDESPEEVAAFIESLTSDQLQKISDWLEDIPTIKYEEKSVCPKCNNEDTVTLEGLRSFF